MSKTILSYPDGAAGVALLLLRLSSGAIAWLVLARLWGSADPWPVAALSALVVLALIAGGCTRVVALLLLTALGALLLKGSVETALPLLACAGSVAALALLGPGAFSVDAHWFGRRVIRLAPRSPDGGGRD